MTCRNLLLTTVGLTLLILTGCESGDSSDNGGRSDSSIDYREFFRDWKSLDPAGRLAIVNLSRNSR